MNRIITILVTIFILLLLYIWISHVWGSDNPRHRNEIVDARQTEVSDGLMADADSTLQNDDITETPAAEEPVDHSTDEFNTERNVESTPATENTSDNHTPPAVEKKKEEPKAVVNSPVEQPKKVTTETTKTETKTTPTSTKSAPAKAAPAKAVATSSSSGTGGKHLVIAGNFTQQVNAQQRVDELKRAGYKNTEIVNFDLSEYHTVCVGRFSDVNEARKLVKKLKDYQKIDAYVRIGS